MTFTPDDPNLRNMEEADRPTWLRAANDTYYRHKNRGGAEAMCEALAIATANKAVKKLKEAAVNPEEILEMIAELEEATWDTAYQNNLPDSSFLYITPGGDRDDEGKTVPRALRYFPVYDASGKVDIPHLRNALARIPQAKLDQAIKDKCISKAQALAKKNLPSYKEARDMRTTEMVELQEVAGMSLNDLLDKLRHAVRDKFPSLPNQDGPWIKEAYDNYLIYEFDGKLFQAAYTVSTDGEITLGDSQEVVEKTSYIPVVQAAVEAADEFEGDFIELVETAADDGTFLAKIISPGWGTSGYYPAEMLKRDAGIYKEGMPMFWDHPTKEEEKNRPERSLRDKAGKLAEDGHWMDNGPLGPGVYAKTQAYTPYRAAIKEMQADIGLSHRAAGIRKIGEAEGRKGPIIEQMTAAHSVDYVTAPGRGGAVTELFEAAREVARGIQAHNIEWGEITLDGLKRNRSDIIESLRSEIKQAVYRDKQNLEEVKRMNDEEVKVLEEAKEKLEQDKATLTEEVGRLQEREILREAKDLATSIVSKSELLDITKERLVENLARSPIIEEGKLDTEKYTEHINEVIKAELEYTAKLIESGKVKGMGSSDSADGKALLKESFKRDYLRKGYSEEKAEKMAETAATGR